MNTLIKPDVPADMDLAEYISHAANYDSVVSGNVVDDIQGEPNLHKLLKSEDIYSNDPLVAARVAEQILEIIVRQMRNGRGATIFRTIFSSYVAQISINCIRSPYARSKIAQAKELMIVRETEA